MNPDKSYYSTAGWKKFSSQIKKSRRSCELCGKEKIRQLKSGRLSESRIRFSCHHKHYRTLGNESPSDVMYLCRRCHDLCHSVLRMNSDYPFVREIKNVVERHFTYEPGPTARRKQK